jgi:2-C-methyl-D-erythritol 2,4-cyclodiphosphate synthase
MYRIGFGSDIHRLVEGRPLMLGGVLIESDLGADGHSDADVLLHAVTDALLGALALGDIGTHFPNSIEHWRNAESSVFLRHAVNLVKEKGYTLSNLDATVHLESPKIQPYVETIRRSFATVLEVNVDCVSLKAKTGEGVGSIGERRAVRADAIVLVENRK